MYFQYLYIATTNTGRVESMLVLTSSAMTSSSPGSTELCTMAFKSESDTTSSLHLAILNSGRMAHTSSARLTTCLATTFVSGWVTFHISKLLPDMLLDLDNAFQPRALSRAYQSQISSRSLISTMVSIASQMALEKYPPF